MSLACWKCFCPVVAFFPHTQYMTTAILKSLIPSHGTDASENQFHDGINLSKKSFLWNRSKGHEKFRNSGSDSALPVCLPPFLPACQSVYLLSYLPARLPVCLPPFLTYLPACLPVCINVPVVPACLPPTYEYFYLTPEVTVQQARCIICLFL
jgi:hypothetical protein